MFVKGKIELARAGDVDLAELTGPGIDVLEDVPVNGLEMEDVETAGEWL